ncbi:MAG: PHP domain-containing protein [Myxococcaceae bacterium]
MIIPGPGWKRPRPLRKLALLLLAAVLGYVGFFALSAARFDYPVVPPAEKRLAPRGAYHLHTTASDGRATPEEIARHARDAGLQFVIITDHNQQAPPAPAWVDGVLVIHGTEVSTRFGHVVALGLPRPLTDGERDQDPVGAITRLGGYAFLAHPEQKKNPWRDWGNAHQMTGLELYSADSMFRTAQQRPFTTFLPAVASYLGNPVHGLLSVVRGQPELTERLLSLSSGTPKSAVCAHDAHGLPPYDTEFQTLSMYVPPVAEGTLLHADPRLAAKKILGDLAEGRGWCAFHALGDGDDFRIDGLSADRSARPGDVLRVALPRSTPPEIQVRVWGPATVLEDGRSIRIDGPGAVQVEVWARVPGMYFEDGWKPWLVPSPIVAAAAPAPSAAPTTP